MAVHNPIDPGDFIRTEVIAAHGLSVTAAAKVPGGVAPGAVEPLESECRPLR
jgi:hypothetical protein